MTGAFETAKRIGKEVSEFVPTSDVSRLNRSGLEGVTVGRHLLTILQRARMISEMTGGAFDVTFASRGKEISYRDIVIEPKDSRVRFKRPGVRIGVSGIAKGYIVDQMGDVLLKKGFRDFLINAGGDVLAKGIWKVGIADPRSRKRQAICTLTLHNKAISTSGTYERGRHIIDPRTRKSVSHFSGVTVITDSTWKSDALGTAFFVGKKQEIQRWLKKMKGVDVILIARNGATIFPSPNPKGVPFGEGTPLGSGSSWRRSCVAGGSRW